MATNLEFIKSASGSSVNTLDIDDCFSDKYDVYKLVIAKLALATAGYQRLRVIDSGGVDSTANYDGAFLEMISGSAFVEGRSTGSTEISYFGYGGSASSNLGGNVLYVYNPYDSSSYTFFQWQSTQYENTNNWGRGTKGIGVHKVAEQITGINMFPQTGNYDNITINVYGLASN